MSKQLAAYTTPSQSYPGYINISQDETDDHSVTITVRGDPVQDREGPTATLKLTASEWHSLKLEISGDHGRLVPKHGSGP